MRGLRPRNSLLPLRQFSRPPANTIAPHWTLTFLKARPAATQLITWACSPIQQDPPRQHNCSTLDFDIFEARPAATQGVTRACCYLCLFATSTRAPSASTTTFVGFFQVAFKQISKREIRFRVRKIIFPYGALWVFVKLFQANTDNENVI